MGRKTTDSTSTFKQYRTQAAFDADRRRMLAEGWFGLEEGTRRGRAEFGLADGLAGLILLPLFWLFNRTQPEQIIVVRYGRAAGD